MENLNQIAQIKEYINKGIQHYKDKLDKEQPKGASKTSITGAIKALENMRHYIETTFLTMDEIKKNEDSYIEGVISLLEYSKYSNIKDLYISILGKEIPLYLQDDIISKVKINIKGQMMYLGGSLKNLIIPEDYKYLHLQMLEGTPVISITNKKNNSQFKVKSNG